ncbi:nicotinamide riboside transporter PnuC [Pedobacter cryotolerans]|uniref:Nicotinamide riboside transporter PnuC n=1 Tax=Pedobacter cryotolerans TaxID=2571270 RepID=A0A4U1BXY3_9SPHI|nr:nicotinamide riboside transporter PnuC [Pedobacter cryotolerans]TKB97424.1 nicotinamide mononucleotide transporter [Pedobacter cryotolerans]
MEIQEYLRLFVEQIIETSYLEWFAVSFGVTEVLLAKRNNILLYPAGIIGILLGIYLKLQAKLYAETLLSMYYLVMSFYGWIIWSKRKAKNQVLPVSWMTKEEYKIAFAIAIGGYFVLYYALVNFTNSDVPILDAFVSSTAWAGMWLLARRKIENWIFLNVSNIVAIPLLWHKDLVLFSLLTLFLFIVAIFGYVDWKKIYQKQLAVSS